MTVEVLVRALALAVMLAGVEMLHGIARAMWLVPRVGKARALRIAIVTGSILAFGVCWWIVPTVGVESSAGLLALGAFLALFMATFDLLLGRFLLRRSWRKTLEDFDPRRGNYLMIGLSLLVWFPLVVTLIRG